MNNEPAKRRLLVATANKHKAGEIRAILGERFEVLDLSAVPGFPPVDETGETFEANAILKAVAGSRHFDGLVLADDSGLEVDVLGGEPGVRSARYSGEGATDATNRAKLLRELGNLGSDPSQWTARFHCVMALAKDGAVVGTFDGRVEGKIVPVERGGGGFGYDPVFVPEGFDQTFGELPAGTKNSLSHRARALQKVRESLDRNV